MTGFVVLSLDGLKYFDISKVDISFVVLSYGVGPIGKGFCSFCTFCAFTFAFTAIIFLNVMSVVLENYGKKVSIV